MEREVIASQYPLIASDAVLRSIIQKEPDIQRVSEMLAMCPMLTAHMATRSNEDMEKLRIFLKSSVHGGANLDVRPSVDLLCTLPLEEVLDMKMDTVKQEVYRKSVFQTLGQIPLEDPWKVGRQEILISSGYFCKDFEGRMDEAINPQKEDTAMIVTAHGKPLFVAKTYGTYSGIAIRNARSSNGTQIIAGGIYTFAGSFVHRQWKNAFIAGNRSVALSGRVSFARMPYDEEMDSTKRHELLASTREYASTYESRGDLPLDPAGYSRENYFTQNGHADSRKVSSEFFGWI